MTRPADDDEARLAEFASARGRWRRAPNMSDGPRDYRRGARWLEWHREDRFEDKPHTAAGGTA